MQKLKGRAWVLNILEVSGRSPYALNFCCVVRKQTKDASCWVHEIHCIAFWWNGNGNAAEVCFCEQEMIARWIKWGINWPKLGRMLGKKFFGLFVCLCTLLVFFFFFLASAFQVMSQKYDHGKPLSPYPTKFRFGFSLSKLASPHVSQYQLEMIKAIEGFWCEGPVLSDWLHPLQRQDYIRTSLDPLHWLAADIGTDFELLLSKVFGLTKRIGFQLTTKGGQSFVVGGLKDVEDLWNYYFLSFHPP